MICEKCGVNKATTHIHSVVNGTVFEKHLCAVCAAQHEKSDLKNNGLSDMLSDIFGNTGFHDNYQTVRCGCCGSSFFDISKSGKCGCAECYSVFYEQLLPYFKRVHGSIKHIGKKPYSSDDKIKTSEIDELQALLSELIKEEKYEQAAVVRDKIKEIKGDTV